MSNTSRVTSKGQVTIPQEIRKRLRLLPHTEVEFQLKNGVATLRKHCDPKKSGQYRGNRVIELMRGSATVKMTTDEILALTRK